MRHGLSISRCGQSVLRRRRLSRACAFWTPRFTNMVSIASLPASMDTTTSTSGDPLDYSTNIEESGTMTKVTYGYDFTRKGEKSLVVNGYKFTKSRGGSDTRIFWRCSRRECKATAVTVNGQIKHVGLYHDHERPQLGETYAETEKTTVTLVFTQPPAPPNSNAASSRFRRKSQTNQPVRGAQAGEAAPVSGPNTTPSQLYPNAPTPVSVEQRPEIFVGTSLGPKLDSSIPTVAQNLIPLPQTSPPCIIPAPKRLLLLPNGEGNRGLSTLAEAAAASSAQTNPESQNSSPDPPFDVPSSQITVTTSSPPCFLRGGASDLNQAILLAKNATQVHHAPSPLLNFLATIRPLATPTTSSSGRRSSLHELSTSARTWIQRPQFQMGHPAPPPNPNELASTSMAAGTTVRDVLQEVARGNFATNWKKDLMWASRVEEEEEAARLQQQTNRYRSFSAQHPRNNSHVGGLPPCSSTITTTMSSASSAISSSMLNVPTEGIGVRCEDFQDAIVGTAEGAYGEEFPSKKRRIRSAEQTNRCPNVAHTRSHQLVEPKRHLESPTPAPSSLHRLEDQPQPLVTASSRLDILCMDKIHRDLHEKLYEQLKVMMANLSVVDEREKGPLMSDIHTCLVTITANKRTWLDLFPTPEPSLHL